MLQSWCRFTRTLKSVRICLESLFVCASLRATHHRIVLVNDATPDPRIAEYLECFARITRRCCC